MEQIVADSSVVIKWFVPQPYSPNAREILDAYQSCRLAIRAPDLIYAEVGNIIWKLHKLQGMSQEDAEAILNQFRTIEFEIVPSSKLLAEAYRLAVKHERTVYDSLYLALSLQQQCQFVTADEKLVNSVSSSIPDVIAIKNWPPQKPG